MDTKQLRQKILDLAIRGKLVPQDPNDEPASVLLERVKAEKERLVAEGKIKRSKKSASSSDKPHYPFEIPNNWVWTRLNEITTLIEDCPHSTAKDEGSGYPLIRTPNVGVGRLLLEGVHRVSKDVYDKRNIRAIPQEGDIIYAREAPAGNAATIQKGEIVCLGQRTVLIRPLKGFVDSLLLTYFINAPLSRKSLISKAVGSTAAHVNMEVIRPFWIPLPPLQEQIRIVKEVERLFTIINSIEIEQIELENKISMMKSRVLELAISGKLVPQDPADEPADELLLRINPSAKAADKSHYSIPSTWIWVKLSDIFEINPKNHNNDDEDDCGFVPMAYVQDGYSGEHTFEVRKWGKVKKGYSHFQNGDIGVAKISPCYENLKSTIFHSLPNNIGAGTTELVIMRGKEIFAPFFLYLFKSPWYISKGTVYFKGVVGQQRVSRDIFTSLEVPLPPLNEQKRISAKVDELFAVIDQIQQSLE